MSVQNDDLVGHGRPSTPREVVNLRGRIERLERALAALGIRFNFDNEGGWLYVISNDSTDIGFGENGILLGDLTGEGVKLFSQLGGQTVLEIIPGGLTVSTGTFSILLSDTEGYISGLGSQATVDGNGVRSNVAAGKTWTVFDSDGDPKLRWTEGDTDLHIPTGGNVVADL